MINSEFGIYRVRSKVCTTSEGPFKWISWAVVGFPNGTTPMEELAQEVWFQFGANKDESLIKLHIELERENGRATSNSSGEH